MSCRECTRTFQDEDLAPLVRLPDGTYEYACRHCITTMIKQGYLWASLPFWRRKAGEDA